MLLLSSIKKMPLIKSIIAITLCTLLSGCISLQPPTANTDFSSQSITEQQNKLKQLTCWSIKGAFSLQSNNQSDIANYQWDVTNDHQYTLTIASTMNLYSVQINRDGNQTTLNDNNHQPTTAASPEALLKQVTGYRLPVSNLYFWVRGLAAPGQQQAQYNDHGHLTHLIQDGWDITLSHYSHEDQFDLPQTIQLTRKNLAIKLVIKQWQTQCTS